MSKWFIFGFDLFIVLRPNIIKALLLLSLKNKHNYFNDMEKSGK